LKMIPVRSLMLNAELTGANDFSRVRWNDVLAATR
jgi:hypothetical protein